MRPILLAVLLALAARSAQAAEYTADPSTLSQRLAALQPGDTLRLSPGTYQHFTVSGLNGDPTRWTTITGPESGAPAIVEANACCNTVEIVGSSYLAIAHLTIDGKDNGVSFGVSAKGGTGNRVHHVRVEECTFLNHGGGQQQVAISTKTPTWGWEIRGNVIDGAGTGLYLGNSDGTSPFIRGLIEHNLVREPIGYCMQIKFQQPWPAVAGIPGGEGTTIIRHNVFIKGDGPSPDGDRPNLLVGGFPDSGPGSSDRYEIYGNLFFHNPRESLLQASGRVSIHDNLFVDASGSAMALQNHDLPLAQAYVYNNTVYATGRGISLGSAAPQGSAAVGNVIFSATPISGTFAEVRDNLTGAVADATAHLNAPSVALGAADFHPKAGGGCSGTAIDLGAFAADTDFDRDFNGACKGERTFRGAYAEEGPNPGWPLAAELKPAVAGAACGQADGGTPPVPPLPPDASETGEDAGVAQVPPDGSTSQAIDGGGQPSADAGVAGAADSGCGCGAAGLGGPALAGILGALAVATRRRPRRAGRAGP